MSGTSIDGVDAMLADFGSKPLKSLAAVHVPFAPALRNELIALQRAGADEIHRAALAAESLIDCFAGAVSALLANAKLPPHTVAAIAIHGQTIRHRPGLGYTVQLANPARL